MGMVSQVFERRSTLREPDEFLKEALGLYRAKSGVSVNYTTAMRMSAVYRAIWLLSVPFGALPLKLYERLEQKGRAEAREHQVFELLSEEPNPEMVAPQFISALQAHVVSWGNGYSEIQYDREGNIVALWPLRPDKTRPIRGADLIRNAQANLDDKAKGDIFYEVVLPDGKRVLLPEYRVFHVPNLGFLGLQGYGQIRLAREAIGLGLAAEEYGARFFANDATPNLALIHPARLKDEGRKNLRESWEMMHQGLENKHRAAILEEGMEIKEIGIHNDDAQWLESRKFGVVEVARFFGVPPHMLYDMDNAHFNNIEHSGIEFQQLSYMPWAVIWEKVIRKKLLFGPDKKRYFAKFSLDALLRGDFKTRMEGYAIGRQWGWWSADDVRGKEDENPLPDGQGGYYMIPLNMMPAEALADGSMGAPQPLSTNARSLEHRSKKNAALLRYRLTLSYRKVFVDAVTRVVRREVKDVKRAAEKYRAARDNAHTFDQWLDGYYQEFPETVRKIMAPAFHALAEAIHDAAADEVGAEAGMSAKVEEALNIHIEKAAGRHTRESRARIRRVMDGKRADPDLDEDYFDDLDAELGLWEETRPSKVALWETTRTSGLVSKAVWGLAGITTLTWATMGTKPCPFCLELDGQTVGMEQPFVSKDFGLEVEGEDPLYPSWNTMTPPLHGGCVCQIIPG